MKIIIDTNILREDYLLNSRKFEMLNDFLSKTDYSIIIPQVVREEILSLYERNITEKYGRILKSIKDFKKIAYEDLKIKLPKLEIDKQLLAYKTKLKEKLILNADSVIPHNKDHLSEIVTRATKRIPPCSVKKPEFRDTMIWLSTLDIAEASSENEAILISANTKDFSDKEGKLNPTLIDEAKKRKVTIQYFKSLDDFLRSKATKIEYINEKWLKDNINFSNLEEQTIEHIEFYGKDDLSEHAKSENSNFESILQIVQCVNTWIITFYVYEMADGSLRVEVFLNSELEVEYSTREIVDTVWETEYVFDPIRNDFDFDSILKEKVIKKESYDYYYPIVKIEAHLLVKDEKVVSAEFVNWAL